MYHGVSSHPGHLSLELPDQIEAHPAVVPGAGGLIYTTHKFPPNYFPTQIINGQTVKIDSGTSVWNFSPQGGGGIHFFTRDGRSLDLG